MRLGKTILVWAVTLMMVADPASACRWRCCGWYYAPRCYAPCPPVACGPVYSSCGPVACSTCEVPGPVSTHRPPSAPAKPPQTFESKPKPAPSELPAPAKKPMPTPSPPSTPAETMPTAPAQPSPEVEDLFSEPSTSTPAEPAAPSDKIDDLFSEPTMPAEPAQPSTTPAEPAAPAEKPAEPDAVEDLFKDFDSKDSGGNSSTSNEKATEGELEELFSKPQDEPPMSAQANPADPLVEEAEKLFAQTVAGTADAAPAASLDPAQLEVRQVDQNDPAGAMRLWTDNTGKHQVQARLVEVRPTHVRLLKENGKFTTVPHSRLSRNDLAFVRQVDRAIVASF